jgi:putative nucleotidyltransferase with HDIG domain
MRKQLEALLPEFRLVKSPALREMTIKVWVEAMKRAGWGIKDLSEMPFTLLIKDIEVNLITHTRAVTLSALRIAEVMLAEYGKKVSIHLDHLLSGALLHDVGKLFEYRREEGKFVKSREGELLRHPISGAAFAFAHGLPQEVVHIIAAHSKEGDGSRRTIEAVIVNHADFVNFDVLKD